MKDKNDKKIQASLAAQQAEDRRLFMEMFNKANAPDPLEERKRASSLAFLDAVEGKTLDAEGKAMPFDVQRTPGMEPYLDLYAKSKEAEAIDANTDTGMFQLGQTGGSSNLIARMKEQSNMRRQEKAAGDLSSAFAGKYAEVSGNTIPFLMKYRQGQNMGMADMMAGKSGQSTGMWASFKPADSIWSSMFKQFAKGAGQGVSMLATGGMGGGGAAAASGGGGGYAYGT
jgi:hypothetical protein